MDLHAYLSGSGPLPAHRAAQLVASLAEHLAGVHAEGRAYGDLGAGSVRVTGTGADVSASVTARAIPSSAAAASANVRAAGALLAELLGATPAGTRPVGVPAVLWHVVESCTAADPGERPDAARLAGTLRDAAKDLLLEAAAPSPAPAAAPRPRYVPDPDLAPAPPPPPGPRRRRAGWALLAGMAGVLAVALAGAGILLPAAGVRLPFANGGAPIASWRNTAVSPTAISGVPAPSSPTDPGAAPGPTPGPSAPPPGPTPGDAPAAPAGADVADAPGPTSATPSPPPPVPPPTAEPTPTPGTSWRTSAFDVPNGTTRPPLVRGKLIWYNRSVGVSAVVWSRSPCASAVFTGYAGAAQVSRIATPYRCGSVTVSQNLDGRTIVGGITRVSVDLYVNSTRVGRDICLRQTAVCTRA